MKDNLNELISMRVFAVITLILLTISISIIAVQVYASTKFWMESSEMRKTKTPDERLVNTEQAIGSLIFGGKELVQYYEQATLLNNATHLFDFKLHSITIYVRDERDAPIGGAYVKAFSPDWGVMYPHYEEWNTTDNNGIYKFTLPTGNWVFIVSSGWNYATNNPNKGIFIETTAYINSSIVITLKPQKSVMVKIVDEKGFSLPVDELYTLSSKYIPAIPPAFIGYSNAGTLTLYTNLENQNLTIVAIKRPSSVSDGYILAKEISTVGQATNIISAANTSKLIVTAYEPDGSLSKYWDIGFRLPDLYLGNWVYTFQLSGRNVFHITPMKAVLNPRYIPPGWYYYFEHIALSLEANREYVYSFGGKCSFHIWVIKQDTQLWFDIRDRFGNVLAFYSDPTLERNITMRIFEEGKEVYKDNIGRYIPGTLFYSIGKTFAESATFELYMNIGPLGGLGKISINGLLYDKSHLVEFKDVQSENFILHIPVGYFWNISGQAREQVFIDTLEAVYKSMGTYLGENLQGKPHRVEVNFEWCGVGGTNSVGFGVGVARWPVHVHHGFLGVLSHELGHMYSFTPPLIYYVGCPLFCEPLATYLGIEALAVLYGPNVRLWYWGTHPGFFDYIAGDKNVPEIERMQFVFFYLHRTYGSDIHKRFIQLWANSTIKDYLTRKGFNTDEIMVTLYSYLAGENLAWLFRMAGYDIPEQRIDEGMKALPTSLSIVMGSLCFDAYGVDRHLVELYFPSARFEPYSKYKMFYSYIIVGGPFVNPNSATIAEKSGIRFGRDWMDVNGTVYRSEWRYSDYAIILIKGEAMYVMGTHRYGTEAALLWLSRKPLFYSYAIIKWVDINRDGNVDLEEVSEVMRI
jgi:hypothetical protein